MLIIVLFIVLFVGLLGLLVWGMLNDPPRSIQDAEACELLADGIDEVLVSNLELSPKRRANAKACQKKLRARAKRSRSGWRLTRW